MNLVKFNNHPFFAGIIDEFDRNFNRNSNYNFGQPAVNIIEEEKQFLIEMAAPGLKKEDFKINLDKQVLTISREAKEENEEMKQEYSLREFGYHHFSRSFRLPKYILADKIKADYKDGILRISLPKDEKVALTRQISVN